jgi:hypothetical protein
MMLPKVLAFHKLTMPWLETLPLPSPYHGLGPNPTSEWKRAAQPWSLQKLVDLAQHPPTSRRLDFGALLSVVEREFGVGRRDEAREILEFPRPLFVRW